MILKLANHAVTRLSNTKKKLTCTVSVFDRFFLFTRKKHSFVAFPIIFDLRITQNWRVFSPLPHPCRRMSKWGWQVWWVLPPMRCRVPLKIIRFVPRLLSVACLSSRHATAPMRVRHSQLFCWNHLCTYNSASNRWKTQTGIYPHDFNGKLSSVQRSSRERKKNSYSRFVYSYIR